MIFLGLYSSVAFACLVVLLIDRVRARQAAQLHREDVLSSLLGAVTWPVLALVYLSVATSVWFIRILPTRPYVPLVGADRLSAMLVSPTLITPSTPPRSEPGEGYYEIG